MLGHKQSSRLSFVVSVEVILHTAAHTSEQSVVTRVILRTLPIVVSNSIVLMVLNGFGRPWPSLPSSEIGRKFVW